MVNSNCLISLNMSTMVGANIVDTILYAILPVVYLVMRYTIHIIDIVTKIFFQIYPYISSSISLFVISP